jgi:hypothetical protein
MGGALSFYQMQHNEVVFFSFSMLHEMEEYNLQ